MTYKEREERNERMRELRKEGMTYKQIGLAVGLSTARVHQYIGGEKTSKIYDCTECVYDGLRDWLNYNNLTTSKLVRMMYGGVANSTSWHNVVNALRGANCKKSLIDRLLQVTGLTYEEAFGGVGNE